MSTRYGTLSGAGATRRSLILLAALAATLLLPLAGADARIHMKTTSPNLVGESEEEAHAGWIELRSFRWHGVTRADRSSKPVFGVFEIEKTVDRSSPYFMQFAAAGWNIGSVVISVAKTTGDIAVDFDRYCLENVIVMSDAIRGGNDEKPIETVTLSYTKFGRWYETSEPSKELFTTGWDTLAFRGTPFNRNCGGVAQ